jgi:aromatic-L-amino-acid/L-tryptophan decarboxylase
LLGDIVYFGCMRERLLALEAIARQLDPDACDREAYREAAVAHGEEFLEHMDSLPAYQQTEDKGAGLLASPIAEEGISIHKALDLVHEYVDVPGLNPASGGHLGYIPGGGLYLSALGDMIADITNRYAGVFFANPGAVRMENMLVRWLADEIGYPKGAAGTLLSGGSLANLACIVTARDAMGISAREVHRSVIYLTEQVHHCVTKAFRIAGLAEVQLRYVPLDSNYRMDVKALRQYIEADMGAGLRPFMVVASTGTTDTGAVDPADEIADVTEHYRMWLHIDAAYGGFFILTEEGRRMIKGLERSDSIVMDPHKGLFLPYGTGVALVKDGARLAASHHYTASYLQDALSSVDEQSPADLSPELTRHFRGLRMWLPLKVHGLAAFRACLSEKLWLARYFWDALTTIPHMERGPYPDLSVVLYRYVPEQGDANHFNEVLVKNLHADGRVFLTSTKIEEVFYIRLACLSFRTHIHTIDLALTMLRENIEKTRQELA